MPVILCVGRTYQSGCCVPIISGFIDGVVMSYNHISIVALKILIYVRKDCNLFMLPWIRIYESLVVMVCY